MRCSTRALGVVNIPHHVAGHVFHGALLFLSSGYLFPQKKIWPKQGFLSIPPHICLIRVCIKGFYFLSIMILAFVHATIMPKSSISNLYLNHRAHKNTDGGKLCPVFYPKMPRNLNLNDQLCLSAMIFPQ